MKCLKCSKLFNHEDSPHYGLHEACFLSWFGLPHKVYFTDIRRRSSLSFEELDPSPLNSSFFHGRYKKYSAMLGNSSYILKKRDEREAPELPEVEYLCNQIGRLLHVPVAKFYIIEDEEEKIFVTKNFITSTKGPIDLQHIYHFVPAGNYNCANIIQVVAEKTKRPHEVNILIQTILFDALIGNHDRHGRNLAFIITGGSTSLSPIYDNISALALEKDWLKADHNPRGAIYTQSDEKPTMKNYVDELVKLGYKDQVNSFYQSVNWFKLEKLIQTSFCTEPMKDAIARLVKKRLQELENEIKS